MTTRAPEPRYEPERVRGQKLRATLDRRLTNGRLAALLWWPWVQLALVVQRRRHGEGKLRRIDYGAAARGLSPSDLRGVVPRGMPPSVVAQKSIERLLLEEPKAPSVD